MSADPADAIFEHRERVRKPGWRKALPWVTGVVVVAVGLALLIIFDRNTGHSNATPLNYKVPAKIVSNTPKTIKLEPGARAVAQEFIRTAVARKHLDKAYTISGPEIVQGQSKKEFMTGNIAVPPYPIDKLALAPMKIDYSYPKRALIEIALLPKQNAHIKSALFLMELDKIHGKWVVNSWVPRSTPPIPSQNDQ